jgi:uncharacterized peroxidase-related enzyme
VTLDESLANAIKVDYKTADVAPDERAMLDYVAKLTLTPARMVEDDVESLRKVGFDDTAILQINLIASWFNYINRVADGLGVGHEARSKSANPAYCNSNSAGNAVSSLP